MAGIDSDLIRGHIDTIILKALYHGDKYGLEIIQEIEEKSNGTYELKQPTLYSCLKRLETQGLISSYWKDSEIGGKRHYYKLTDEGLNTYKANQEEWLRSREIIDNLIYNTSIDYAPIYSDDQVQVKKPSNVNSLIEDDSENADTAAENLTENADDAIINDNEKSHVDSAPLEEGVFIINDKTTQDNAILETNNTDELLASDYMAEDGNDEFASFDDNDFSKTNESFFASNSETSSPDEFKQKESTAFLNTNENSYNVTKSEDLVSLNLDEISASEDQNSTKMLNSTTTSDPNIYTETDAAENNNVGDLDNNFSDEIYSLEDTMQSSENNNSDNDIYTLEDKSEVNTNDDDELYNINKTEDTENNEQIYNFDNPDNNDQPKYYSPTYVKFEDSSKPEADLTSLSTDQEDNLESTDCKNNEGLYNDYFVKDSKDNQYSINNQSSALNNDSSIEDTATKINEKYYNTIPHASEEEINNLYKTTENYENLQAGYTDETYKQMLSELEYYSNNPAEDTPTKTSTILSLAELTEQFETEGIVVRKHTKQVKESDDSKMYVKTNQIHFVKNWITFGITALVLLITFGIMSAFKSGYTYNFAFWQFIVAIAVGLLIPIYSTIKYLINPYKKVVAKYAPRLSMLLSALITIQLILVIYCVNLQLGFYSFSQENYCHLLWILPLILSFTPIIQSLIYMPLYNSKRFHI